MTRILTLALAASFAASAAMADAPKSNTTTVVTSQNTTLPAAGLNPAIPFALVGITAAAGLAIAIAVSDDDDDNSTTSTTR